MELSGKVVVITGAGSGIGSALARRIAPEVAGVVVADVDGAGAARTAADIGPRAVPVTCDVTRSEDMTELLHRAAATFGPVDIFVANAGIAIGGDEQTPDEVWERSLAVNVHAHVTAARVLVPDWLARGEGCFVAVASAAGLLTQLNVAPYAVSKHAAVAFAEWLAVTYGDRGIHVSCVCPMGVDTQMVRSGMDLDAVESVRLAGEMLSPDAVAESTVEGIRNGRFLILPHPEVLQYFARKATDYDGWIAGMQQFRRSIPSAERGADQEP